MLSVLFINVAARTFALTFHHIFICLPTLQFSLHSEEASLLLSRSKIFPYVYESVGHYFRIMMLGNICYMFQWLIFRSTEEQIRDLHNLYGKEAAWCSFICKLGATTGVLHVTIYKHYCKVCFCSMVSWFLLWQSQ